MGAITRALGFERDQYRATQLHTDSAIETTAGETRGELLEITPNPENHGPGSMAAVYEAMYEPATRPVHSVEIWFHGGEARFFILADTETAADSIRRSISNNYSDSEVETVAPNPEGFPTVQPDDFVSGAYVEKYHPRENHQYLPIRSFSHKDGWREDQNPIAEIIARMQTGKETSVVVQAAIDPLPSSWTRPGPLASYILRAESADDVKQHYRENGDSDLKRMVEKQTVQSPFAVNLRILSISPDEDEARNRTASVAGIFERRFTSSCGMGLSSTAVDGRTAGRHRSALRKFVERMRTRADDAGTCTVLGHEELTALHIPSGEAGAPAIGWKHARSGSDAPVNRPEHSTPSLDDLPEHSRPITGQDRSGGEE